MDKELLMEKEHHRKLLYWMFKEREELTKSIRDLEELERKEFKSAGGTFSQSYELTYNRLLDARLRLGALEDSIIKPYFGRIDFKEKLASSKDIYYIGKHSVRDRNANNEYVIDWRAPISDLYYSKTEGDAEYKAPKGFIKGNLSLKRRFTYLKGENLKEEDYSIDRYFDEGDEIIVAQSDGEGKTLQDEFLRINLEESSTTKLKEIVATIAREQNEIIRSEKNIPIIVQGAAGAGKTTVALHRLSYLLYKYRDSIKEKDLCIIAPNTLFLDYISQVLPDLGNGNVIQTTLEDKCLKELKIKKYSRNKDEILKSILEEGEEGKINAGLSKFKGSLDYLKVLDMMVSDYESKLILRNSMKVYDMEIYKGDEIVRLFTRDLSYLNLKDRKEQLKNYCDTNLKLRLGKIAEELNTFYDRKVRMIKNIYSKNESEMRLKIRSLYEERDEKLKNLNREAKKSLKNYFSLLNLERMEVILSSYLQDAEFMTKVLTSLNISIDKEVLYKLKSFDEKNITSDDLSALMYLKIKLNGTGEIYSHMVVDEAQDYSPLQIEVLRNFVRQDSLTLVGDLAQGIYSFRALENWEEAGDMLKDYIRFDLKKSYRSTVEIIKEANVTLRKMNLKINEAVPVLRHGMVPERRHVEMSDLAEVVKEIENSLRKMGRNSFAVVTRTYEEAKEVYGRLKNKIKGLELIGEDKKNSNLTKVVIPSYMTKGLEFDCVILENENSFSDCPLDQRLKYVSLTRALHMEYILYR